MCLEDIGESMLEPVILFIKYEIVHRNTETGDDLSYH